MQAKKKSAGAKIPFPFVLDELAECSPYTKPMFGCLGVYVGEKIVLIMRHKAADDPDNGIWVATTGEHHVSLLSEFPSLRSLVMFGPGPTGWQNLPLEAPDFEEAALGLCRAVRAGDPRIGKTPARRRPKTQTRAKARAKPKQKKGKRK